MRNGLLAVALLVAATASPASAARFQTTNNIKHVALGVTVFEDDFLVAAAPAIAPEDEDGIELHIRKACGKSECYTTRDITYFTDAAGGGLLIEDATGLRFSAFGEQLFDGSTSRPVFRFGTFNFTSDRLGNPITATLTVASVPEPASWAMLIAGFGLTGAAMRRKRQTQPA